jgi:quercetin dioxygenase-like cupin family protein
MEIKGAKLKILNWDAIDRVEHFGQTGNSYWRTFEDSGIRIRIVEYPVGYVADHWCEKGHIVHLLKGRTEFETHDGMKRIISAGMTYKVSENYKHRSRNIGNETAKLLITD